MADDSGNGVTPMTLEQLAHAFEADREANRGRFGDFESRWGGITAEQASVNQSVAAFRCELQDHSGRIGDLALVVHELKVGLDSFRQEIAPTLRELVGAVGTLVARAAAKRARGPRKVS